MQRPYDRLFLASSDRALRALAESHDFFWGSGVALHNLRWQVMGFSQAYPNATQADISQRFANVSGLPGSNAFNLILRRPWNEVEALLNQVRLSNIISIYEGWIAAAEAELGVRERSLEKPMQFHTDFRRLVPVLGGVSTLMTEVSDRCVGHKANRLGRESDLFACYRAFKETRNALAHAGSIANQRTVDRVAEYEAVKPGWSKPTQAVGGLPAFEAIGKEPPNLDLQPLGEPVVLTDRGVAGFSGVLRTMIVTFDGLIASTDAALRCAKRRWTAAYGPLLLPADPSRAAPRFRTRWRQAGLPELADGTGLLSSFRADRLVI